MVKTSPIITTSEEKKSLNGAGIHTRFAPKTLDTYIGQNDAVEMLKIVIASAKNRGDKTLAPVLVTGPAGIGKTTLAQLVGKELGSAGFIESNAPAIHTVRDLNRILKKIKDIGTIVFIDEVHSLHKKVEEHLYKIIDCDSQVVLDEVHRIPRFTLVAATTQPGLISTPLQTRMTNHIELDFFDKQAMVQLVDFIFEQLDNKVEITENAINEIAIRSKDVPRVAINNIKKVCDYGYTLAKNNERMGNIDVQHEDVMTAFKKFKIDKWGFDYMDTRYIMALMKPIADGARSIGLKNIANLMCVDVDKVLQVEEYFIRKGLVVREPRGRLLTAEGRHLAEEKFNVKLKVQESIV